LNLAISHRISMSLPTPAAQASKAALSAAIAENGSDAPTGEDSEVQEVEVNMENQADHIRTVFSDPTNFNVKVRTTTFVRCRPCV
jgi:translation initiation factor 4E